MTSQAVMEGVAGQQVWLLIIYSSCTYVRGRPWRHLFSQKQGLLDLPEVMGQEAAFRGCHLAGLGCDKCGAQSPD